MSFNSSRRSHSYVHISRQPTNKPMKLTSFDPPGMLDDFSGIPQQMEAWSDFVGQTFDEAVGRVEQAVGAGNSPYYNPVKVSTDERFAAKTIRWKGFPRIIRIKHPGNAPAAWKEAETFLVGGIRPQDEYVEWHVEKNAAGKVVRVTFTCEPPEYYEALAQGYPFNYEGVKRPGVTGDRNKLLELYRQYISPDVQMADLFNGDTYNRRNKWNSTNGAMHLQQGANTLYAEIILGGDATVLRKRNGQVLTDPDALIECGKYGEAERASDPHIGSEVNSLAREGFAITLQNPVGLYMEPPDTAGWQTPDGTPALTFWKRLRGTEEATVRAVFEVPAGKGYAVGDIKIGGVPIQFGGQIAESISVKLTGIACRKGSKLNAANACVPAEGFAALAAAAPDAAAVHPQKATRASY
jgi:hypothetical protein